MGTKLAVQRSKGGRLQFDPALVADIHRQRQSQNAFPVFSIALCAMLLLALAVWASQTIQMPAWAFFQNNGNLDKACLALLQALQNGPLDTPLEICADSPAGTALLQKENTRLFRQGDSSPATQATAPSAKRPSSNAILAAIRRELVAAGVNCEQIRPLAFGGVKARIMDPATMEDTAESVTGEVFFSAGQRLFALQLTARRCGADFIITDLWQCLPLDIAPEAIKERVAQTLKAFKSESSEGVDAVKIKSPRQVFVLLET